MSKLIVLTLAFLCVLSTALANKQAKFAVIKAPSVHEYNFNYNTPLKLSRFNDFLLSVNGFSIPNRVEWEGLKNTNARIATKVTVLVVIDNSNFKIDSFSTKTFPIDEDSSIDFDRLKEATANTNSLVKIFDHLPSQSELKDVDCSRDSAFYIIKYDQSVDSSAVSQNVDKLMQTFSECTADNELLVYLLSVDQHKFEKRQASRVKTQGKQSVVKAAAATTPEPKVLNNDDKNVSNPAEFYSDQYPAMFNLIFWTSLILGLAVFFITYSMWSMDPGLDTVIYRMTSQRIKKDQ